MEERKNDQNVTDGNPGLATAFALGGTVALGVASTLAAQRYKNLNNKDQALYGAIGTAAGMGWGYVAGKLIASEARSR